jgi:hypothetical protein
MFGSCASGFRTAAQPRETVDMFSSQKDGRMRRILAVDAAQPGPIQGSDDRARVVQRALGLMRRARQRVILRD